MAGLVLFDTGTAAGTSYWPTSMHDAIPFG